MTASVTLVGVSIKKINKDMGKIQYNGTVIFRAESDYLKFDYEYKFDNADNIEAAIANAVMFLKRDLDNLSSATQSIRYIP